MHLEDFPISLNPFQRWTIQRRCTLWRALLALITCGVLAGCHPAPKLTPQQAEGKHLYDVRCAHCHEDNDLGLKKIPPRLQGLFRQTSMPSGAPVTDAEVERVVTDGKGMMPSFAGRFNREQMDALIAYLHTGMPGEQAHR